MNGLTTWQDVAAIDGNVLLIVNSPAGDVRAAALAFDTLAERVRPERLHVVATAGWSGWLSGRGRLDERVLLGGADTAGEEIELNYFLESADALGWIQSRNFAAVVGSAPHNLYNEEIKDTFEQRVGVILGTARFLVHTLPEPYVFSLSLADLLQRFNRGRKAAAYGAVCRALVDDVYRAWTESGRGGVCDGRPFDEVVAVLERHLGAGVLSWDEASPIPLDRPDVAGAAADFLSYLGGTLTAIAAGQHGTIGRLQDEIERRDGLLRELNTQAIELQRALGSQQDETNQRDQRLAALHEELAREVELRDRRLAELHEESAREVEVRDRRLVELHEESAREVEVRDRRLVELHEESAREVEVRDRRLAELHEELAREVQIRDHRLVELHEELVQQVQIRDRNLVAMDQDRRESVAQRDGIIAELRREIETLRRGPARRS